VIARPPVDQSPNRPLSGRDDRDRLLGGGDGRRGGGELGLELPLAGLLVVAREQHAAGACAPLANQPQESTTSSPGQTAAGRYVTTIGGRSLEMILHADGTATVGGQPGTWQQTDGATIVLSDGRESANGSIEGDTITIYTAEGPIVFRRDGGAGEVAGAGVGRVAAPGPTDGRLVGCWEDVSGSSGGTGSHAYQRTVRFGADASYAARSYSAVSAGDFSSVSDETEEGTWSASGSTISFTPYGKGGYQVGFQLGGGLLYLGESKFVPCS
jgi:hypothetical protein